MRNRGLAVALILVLLGVLAAVFTLEGGKDAGPSGSSPSGSLAGIAQAPETPDAPPVPEGATASPGRSAVGGASAAGTAAAAPAGEVGSGSFFGRVVAADGSPVPGAAVSVFDSSGPLGMLGPAMRFRAPREGDAIPGGQTARTKEDGTFEVSGLAPGTSYGVSISAEGFLPGTAPGGNLGKGERKDVGSVTLTREALVAGTVTDPSGRPVAGAVVSLEIEPTRIFKGAPLLFQEEKTDDVGRYRLGALPEGKIRVLARAEGWREGRSEEVEAKAGRTVEGVDVRLLSGRAIAGRVFSREGKPVAGAEVFAMPEKPQGETPFVVFRVFRRDPARTDASGRYEVSGLADGAYRVEVEAEGFASASRNGIAVGTGTADFTLDPLARLAGRVVDGRSGKPVSAFQAKAVRDGLPVGRAFFEGGPSAEGKEDGSFEISGLEPGSYRVEVRSEGFSPATAGPIAVTAGAVAEAGSISLHPGSTLRVRVVEAGDASPIPGAEVSVHLAAEEAGFPRGAMRVVERAAGRARLPFLRGMGSEVEPKKTDAEGAVEFPGLAEGNYSIRVKEKDHASATKESFVSLAAPAEVEAALSKGGTVHGRVTHASGEPFPGAEVFLASAVDLAVEEETTAGADGAYEFAHVTPGDWRVGISEDESLRIGGGASFIRIRNTRVEGFPAEERGVPVTVSEGKTVEVDLQEKTTGAVTGRVTDAGEAVAGVRVSLTAEGQPRLPFLSNLASESGPDGRYRIEGVKTGRYTLSAQKTGAAVPAEQPVDVAGGEVVADVELPRGAIEGRILDLETGRGLAGAEVSVSREQRSESGGRPMRATAISVAFTSSTRHGGGGRTEVRMGGGGEIAKTDSEGRFRLEGVPPGTYALSASLENYADGRRTGLAVERDRKLEGIDLSLGRGGAVTGTVLDAAGSPVSFALVEVAPKEGEPKRMATGPDGVFEVGGLAAGTYEVSARIPGPPGPNERRATQPGVRVEAGRKASVELRLPN